MSRRGENIYKRKDGRWEGRVRIPCGKYQSFYAKSYTEVKEKMKAFLENHKMVPDKPSTRTRDAVLLFEDWLAGDVFFRVKPATYDSYYSCMHQHILPFFQNSSYEHITEVTVLNFTKAIRDDPQLAETTKKKICSIFKIALKDTMHGSAECLSYMGLIKLPKRAEKEVQIFSIKEQKKIEAAVLQAQDKRALGILLCFYTGVRLGELCALKWCDIDMDSGIMSITRTISRIKNHGSGTSKTILAEGTPKSHKSIRKIPLPDFLLKIFIELRFSVINKTDYVFSGKENPVDPRSYQKIFKMILKDTQLPDRKFHAIRHTFATRALELGVDMKTLSELLGHSNVSITLGIYAHSLIEHKRVAIEKFNGLYAMNG